MRRKLAVNIVNRILTIFLTWFYIVCLVVPVETERLTFPKTETYEAICPTYIIRHIKGENIEAKREAKLKAVQVPPRHWTYDDIDVISRMVWGEARGVSRNEQKLVVWTVIKRLDMGNSGNSLIGVVRAPSQFHGYSPNFPVTPEIREMVIEVLEAWERGETALVYYPFATTPYYLYFGARRWNGWSHNFFRETWM
jgi:spore germination cell wall hydrolase CwlJ-like protein